MKIIVENLNKKYEKNIAVNNLNLEINHGELISILGPSGCGKSTLLYMLAGIVEPTSGNIYFDGGRVNEIPTEKRNIGLVFQNYSLYPHMTVLENLIFPLQMGGMKKKSAVEKAFKIADRLKIEDLFKRKPRELSGGQQQRVAIGRALIKKPKLLLMDEPFSNLDASLRVSMREEIKELHKNFEVTTIFVTHDQEESLAISDRILLMNYGQAMQYSEGEEIYNNPRTKFAAEFIGNPKINIIDSDNAKALSLKLKPETKYVGIRPEDIVIHDYEQCKEREYLEGVIKSVQHLGKETHFKISIKDLILIGLTIEKKHDIFREKVKITFRKIHFFEE